MKQIIVPKLTGPKNPKRLNMAISNTIYDSLKKAKALGINGPELVRMILEKELPEYIKEAS